MIGACYFTGDCFNVREISISGFGLRGTDCDKDGIALAGGLGEIGHETNLCIAVTPQKTGQMVLVDEGIAPLESGDLSLIIIYTDNVMAHFSEADSGDQANVT